MRKMTQSEAFAIQTYVDAIKEAADSSFTSNVSAFKGTINEVNKRLNVKHALLQRI